MRAELPDPRGLRVTVMGLGLNGGGLYAAMYFARRGAKVTVTDLKTESVLGPSIEKLAGLDVRYVLGRHEPEDFRNADLVIKNPGVRLSSPFLAEAIGHGVAVETDLSVFLRAARNPLIAVTGTKGKSTTSSAIHHALRSIAPEARLAGNITFSPLGLITPPESLPPGAPVVLELSSWQLGDLRGKGLLDPVVSVYTVIFPDHMDSYGGDMGAYVRDKRTLLEGQSAGHLTVLNRDDRWQESFSGSTLARALYFSRNAREADAWFDGSEGKLRAGGREATVLDGSERIKDAHGRTNLLTAALALHAWGMDPELIRGELAAYPGLEHRLERFLECEGIAFINDSAATVPEATLAAAASMELPYLLICGGSDKQLDFAPFSRLAPPPRRAYVLAGTAEGKVLAALSRGGIRTAGPFSSLESAVSAALGEASPDSCILFSPGCTSFGMFLNEFDRGRRFKDCSRSLAGA